MLLALLLIAIGLPVAWCASEFRDNRALRIALGILSIGYIAACIYAGTGLVTTLQYNALYGSATGDLISTSVQQIEDGNLDRVLKVWRGLDLQYQPTYENRAGYDELVEEATSRIRGDVSIESDSPWNAPLFTADTWQGHWEDDHGYWIVIDRLGQEFDVLQSGQPRADVHSTSVSPDFKVLTFKEGDQWLHTLTLKNKYEASYEWTDLKKGTIWKTMTVHKLIRASNDQKRMTQQQDAADAKRAEAVE